MSIAQSVWCSGRRTTSLTNWPTFVGRVQRVRLIACGRRRDWYPSNFFNYAGLSVGILLLSAQNTMCIKDCIKDCQKRGLLMRKPKEISLDARERSEARFEKKEERAREGAKAAAEYKANIIAVREKTARLRALRLAAAAQKASSPSAPKLYPPFPPKGLLALADNEESLEGKRAPQ
jgi:hypothetical protein